MTFHVTGSRHSSLIGPQFKLVSKALVISDDVLVCDAGSTVQLLSCRERDTASRRRSPILLHSSIGIGIDVAILLCVGFVLRCVCAMCPLLLSRCLVFLERMHCRYNSEFVLFMHHHCISSCVRVVVVVASHACILVEQTDIVITHIFVKRSKEFKCVRRRTSSVQSIVIANAVNVALFFGGDKKAAFARAPCIMLFNQCRVPSL